MPTADAEAPQFGPWRSERLLGKGGMGRVFLAHHDGDGSVAAVKTVVLSTGDAIATLRREVDALRRLDHPGVVRVLDSGLDAGEPWYAMSYVAGERLTDRLRRWWQTSVAAAPSLTFDFDTPDLTQASYDEVAPGREGLDEHELVEVLTLFRQLCQTLAFLHGEGVVHRDLKPANVLFDDAGLPVLVDFGITRRFAGGSSRERLDDVPVAAGTLAYVAPEQLSGAAVDARADLYALGCMLFEALTGAPPFASGSNARAVERILTEPPRPPSTMATGIPPELDELVLEMLAKNPSERAGFADDVARRLGELGGEARPEGDLRRPRPYLYRSRFVGREDALGHLQKRIDEAIAGDGATVAVVGPSGTGKTRLVFEAATHAANQGVLVLFGACEPVDLEHMHRPTARASALHPFRPLLRYVADRCRAEGPETTRRLLGPLGRSLEVIEPALSTLPGISADPLAPLRGDAARERRLYALTSTIAALAAEHPLLLVLDDLQWADEATVMTLEVLARPVDGARPWLVVSTVRSEATHDGIKPFLGLPRVERLDIKPLTEQAIGAVLQDMLGHPEAPTGLLRQLASRARGNPFYAAEFLHAAVGLGMLARNDSGKWVLSKGTASDLALPEDPDAAIALRLDRLDAAARSAAGAAAVLGRVFDESLLSSVTHSADTLRVPGLDHLIAERVVEEVGDGRLAFLHDKLRERVYERMDAAERRELHRRTAEAMTASRDQDDGVIAYHWRQAGLPERSYPHLVRGGRQGLERGDTGRAERLLESAIDLIESGHVRVDPIEVARLRQDHSAAVLDRGDVGRSLAGLQRAMADLDAPLPTRGFAWGWRLFTEILRQIAHRWLPGPKVPDEPEARARLSLQTELADRITGAAVLRNDPGLSVLGSILGANLGERAGAADRLAPPYAFIGMMVGTAGMTEVADRYFERARDHIEKSDDLELQVRAACIEAYHRFMQCEWDTSERIARSAFERAMAAAAHHHTRFPLYQLVLTSQTQGHYDDAHAWIDLLLSQAHRSGSNWAAQQGALVQSRQALFDGDLEACEAITAATLEMVDLLEEAPLYVNLLSLRAAAAMFAGRRREALLHVRHAETLVGTLGGNLGVAFNVLEFAPAVRLDAWATSTTPAEAAEHKQALQTFLPQVRKATRTFKLAGPLADRHHGRFLVMSGQEGKGLIALRRSMWQADERGIPWEHALSALAVAETPAAPEVERRDAAARARVFFEASSTAWALARLDRIEQGLSSV